MQSDFMGLVEQAGISSSDSLPILLSSLLLSLLSELF